MVILLYRKRFLFATPPGFCPAAGPRSPLHIPLRGYPAEGGGGLPRRRWGRVTPPKVGEGYPAEGGGSVGQESLSIMIKKNVY
jgi:hypothetical protein